MTAKPLLLGLVGLTLLAYAPVRHAGFVYEDLEYLKPAQRGLVATEVLAPRGLTAVSFWVNYRLSGLDPRPYHALNLGLHLLVGLLVYAVARRWLSPLAATLAAALHLLHPLNSETVSYLAGGRAELLAALGVLSVIWALSAPQVTWGHAAVALVGAVWAVGGKELGVLALPLAGLCAVWGRSWRLRWNGHAAAGAALALGVFGVLTIIVLDVRVLGNLYLAATERGALAYLALQSAALWLYLGRVVVPSGLTVDHDIELVTKGLSLVALALTVSAPLVALWWRRRAPVITLGIWWLALALGPRFVVRQSEYLAEHHLYLGFVGLWIALAAGLQALARGAVARTQEDACAGSVSVSS